MCLMAEKGSRRIAEKDITVYKAVLVCQEEPNIWRGIYVYNDKKFPFNEVADEGGVEEERLPVFATRHGTTKMLEIGKNFFHSNGDVLSAKILKFGNNRMKIYGKTYESYVCKATIPKGAVYYIDRVNCYASDKIIVHKPKNL